MVRIQPETLRGKPEGCTQEELRLVVLLDREELHPVEVAYLLYNDAVEAYIGERRIGFEEYMRLYAERNPLAVPILEVYIELRRRGRLVIPGPRENTLLLIRSRRNPQPTHYVMILEEGRPVRVAALEGLVEEARRKNLEPVLAIVDRYGDVTFYTPMVFHPSGEGVLEESLESEDNARPASRIP